jgi:branched-chain amino acid aminotransferase
MNRVWLNGALLPAEQARIDPADRGFTLGDGMFETIRAVSGKPAYLDRHLARLRHGAGVLGIEIGATDDTLETALHDVAGGRDCALRLTLTRGPMPRGVLPSGAAQPTILITGGPLPAPQAPARVMIAHTTRRNEHSPLARIKSLNYGDSILARQEAERQGFDDSLLLNTAGNLAEASAANVFLLIDDEWVTPRVADGALPGIRRAFMLEAGQAREESIAADDIRLAKAGFIANAIGVRRLVAIGSVALNQQHRALSFLDDQTN